MLLMVLFMILAMMVYDYDDTYTYIINLFDKHITLR